jgi:hypothetical protein
MTVPQHCAEIIPPEQDRVIWVIGSSGDLKSGIGNALGKYILYLGKREQKVS